MRGAVPLLPRTSLLHGATLNAGTALRNQSTSGVKRPGRELLTNHPFLKEISIPWQFIKHGGRYLEPGVSTLSDMRAKYGCFTDP
jgi:hypothetical protein